MRGIALRTGFLACAGVLITATCAAAATFKVTRADDPSPGACTASDCSLREAVLTANTTGASDRIVLLARTYRLTQAGAESEAMAGDLNIDPDFGRITVVGKGRNRSVIDGTDTDRIFELPGGARLTLRSLAIQNGNSISVGGAIRSDGSVTIANAGFASNHANGQGGAIYSATGGRLRVSRTYFNRNEGSDGGAIYHQNESEATLTRLVFTRNEAVGEAGAIYNQNDAVMTLTKSTLDRNTSMDPLNGGGAIFNQNNAELRIQDSTISRNRAPLADGGGIYSRNDSLLALTNVTLSGNSATEGGALYIDNFPMVTIAFSTIAKNTASFSGGGIFDAADPPGPPGPAPFLRLRGTLVGQNTAPGTTDNCATAGPGIFESLGGNVEDDVSCVFTRRSDTSNSAMGLRRLGRNGGPTKTHALKPSSDAVNVAKKKGCPKRDQRGVKRPQGKRCDAGSYELKLR